MRRLAPALLALAAAAPGAAEPVTPEAFEAMSEGRTLHFFRDGAPFGDEQFFTGRRSLWRFADGTCEPGRWAAEGEQICFVYDSDPAPICWLFRSDGPRFLAELADESEAAGFTLELDRIVPEPLPCPAPDLGS